MVARVCFKIQFKTSYDVQGIFYVLVMRPERN